MITQTEYLDRAEAVQYLLKRWGRPASVTQKTLEKYASVGGGPLFHKFGRKVGYTTDDLDQWAQGRACIRTSSSDPGRPLHPSAMAGASCPNADERIQPA
jgi:hypothetical protein